MVTQIQQIVSSLLLLAFGVLALRVWRRARTGRLERATLAWGLTAANFLVVGGYSSAHSLIAALGWSMGRDSALYQWVGSWALAANVGRGVVSVLFPVLLLAVLVLHRRWAARVAQHAPAALAVTAVAGTAAALLLPDPTSMHTLTTLLAVMCAATAIVLMAALLAGVLSDGMDQLLWLALAVYALKETLSVSLLAVIGWWSLAAQVDAYRLFYWLAMALNGSMVLLARRRLRLAVGGRHVPALFERAHALRRSPAA